MGRSSRQREPPVAVAEAKAVAEAEIESSSSSVEVSEDAASPSSSSSSIVVPNEAHILSAKYLERRGNKHDLVKRLRQIVQLLRQDESIEPSPEFPGLASLCHALLTFVDHRDKEVRLYTVSACMELFTIYAPEAPWDTAETLHIFRQTIRQLANLAHTTSPSQSHFASYLRILELLAHVKIGVVLVDLTKNLNPQNEQESQEALQVLADLFRTILQSVRLEHPPEIAELTQQTISACLEEYYEGVVLPTPLLDEVLIAIGQGPLVLVTNPQKAAQLSHTKQKRSLPPHQVEQVNPSYLVAASVVRKTVDRLSTPIAQLLNGLLNGNPRTVAESSIQTDTLASHHLLATPQPQEQTWTANVWSIVYEFHKIAPPILTTVIGTVANFLTVPDVPPRLAVVQLLGKLFTANHATLALQFRPCFRTWLKRANDVETEIRLSMIQHLIPLLSCGTNTNGGTTSSSSNENGPLGIAQDAEQTLGQLLEYDACPEVRLDILHRLCDLAHRHRTAVSPHLLQLVASRVSSKHKQERKDALTGLAQTYHRQYMAHHLQAIHAGGDNVDLECILSVLRRTCTEDGTSSSNSSEDGDDGPAKEHEDHVYRWIPQKIFECVCFTDLMDTEMRSRVVQVVDELLLGSELPKSTKKWTPTARAVGLAMLLNAIPPHSNADSWMNDLLAQRAKLQRALAHYLDARALVKEQPTGSEQALTANAKAEDLLEVVAHLTAPPPGTNMISIGQGERNPILAKFHAAKDKHIFRILSTIVTCTHSNAARIRALEELPKRVKSLGDATVTWVKTLARRCTMGDFCNAQVIHHCIMLCQECFREEDLGACMAFLKCVQLASQHYPELCATPEAFGTLMELFTEARGMAHGKYRKEVDQSGLVTVLSSILAAAAPSSTTGDSSPVIDEGLHKQLLNLCSRDGTPEQARHAVSTMASLLNPSADSLTQEQNDAFSPLLKSLTSPSRLTLEGKDSTKLISVLTALAELAEHAPSAFDSTRGQKALTFALEMVLLGRAHETENGAVLSDDEDEQRDQEGKQATSPDSAVAKRRKSTPARKRSSSMKNLTPNANASILEDESLSVACRRLCAAIEFLVSYIRTSILVSKDYASSSLIRARSASQSSAPTASQAAVTAASHEIIEKVFDVLTQLLRDHGLPPSTHDRKDCKMRQDRAALRQVAATHLLRLCDARLSLDKQFLTPPRWHTLSGAFLDDEKVVRDKVMEELGLMLTGNGKYGKVNGATQAMAPRLRFLALIALCTDGDHGADHSGSNGNAANVGKRSSSTKENATKCVGSLRKICEATAAQFRAMGEGAAKRFENEIKVMLMPEYVVPYAFHLLAYRRESPFAGGAAYSKSSGLTQTSQEDELYEVDEGQQRVLRKRLKWLFDPLVQSLGDSADNLSFLLRMTELMGKQFRPVGLSRDGGKGKAPFHLSLAGSDSEDEKDVYDEVMKQKAELAASKLKIVCAAAREVLLSYVKKDVNLTTYPGTIQLPGTLFHRKPSVPKRRSTSASAVSHQTSNPASQETPTESLESREISPAQKPSRAVLKSLESKGSSRNGRDTRNSLRSTDSSTPESPSEQSRKRPSQENAGRRTRSNRESIESSSTSQTTTEAVSAKFSQESEKEGPPPRRNRKSQGSHESSQSSQPIRRSTRSSVRNSLDSDITLDSAGKHGRVHFSPDLKSRKIPPQASLDDVEDFGGLSPIRAAASPHHQELLSSGEKTRGTTPPSILRGGTISATASPGREGTTDSESPISKTSELQEHPSPQPDNSGDFVVFEDEDGIKTTSETPQSSPERYPEAAKKSRGRKRPSPDKTKAASKKARKDSVPFQIKITRHKPVGKENSNESVTRPLRKSRPKSYSSPVQENANDLDFFGSDIETEDEEGPKGNSRGAKKNKLPTKKAPAKASPTAAKRPLAAHRSRRKRA